MQRRYFVSLRGPRGRLFSRGARAAMALLPHRGLMSELSSSTAVYDSHHRFAAVESLVRSEVPARRSIERVSPQLREAVLLHEDRFFYDHPGVNRSRSRGRVQTYAVRGRRVGGSTLTMAAGASAVASQRRESPRGEAATVFAHCSSSLYSKREILEALSELRALRRERRRRRGGDLIYFGKPVDARRCRRR